MIISVIVCCRAACRIIYNRDRAQGSWRMLYTAGPKRLNFIIVNKSKTNVENGMQTASRQSMVKVYFLSIHVRDPFNIPGSQRRTKDHSLPLNPQKWCSSVTTGAFKGSDFEAAMWAFTCPACSLSLIINLGFKEDIWN